MNTEQIEHRICEITREEARKLGAELITQPCLPHQLAGGAVAFSYFGFDFGWRRKRWSKFSDHLAFIGSLIYGPALMWEPTGWLALAASIVVFIGFVVMIGCWRWFPAANETQIKRATAARVKRELGAELHDNHHWTWRFPAA